VTVPPAAAQAACWLEEAVEAIRRIDAASVAAAADLLLDTRRAGGTIFVAGNGGSAAAASHLALDLQKAGRAPGGKGTPALSLSDSMGLVTAWGNDTAFERVFAEQLEVLGKPGDALVVISVSGSSPNLVALLEAAARIGIRRVGLLGRTGGAALALVEVPVLVPSDDYGWVESAHVVLHHVLTYAVRDAARAGRG
jgi:D-sedoheptulose 7-phosphate isomerase